MTSDTDDNPWDFRAARQLLRAFRSKWEPSPPSLGDSDIIDDIPNLSLFDLKSSTSKSLGDFDRVFTFCGKPIDVPNSLQPSSNVKNLYSSDLSSSPRSDQSTLPSSADDDVPNVIEDSTVPETTVPAVVGHYDYINKIKEVRWKDGLAEPRRRSTHGSAADLDATVVAQILDHSDTAKESRRARRSRRKLLAHSDTGKESRRSRRKRSSSRSVHLSDFESEGETDTDIDALLPQLNQRSKQSTLVPSSVTPQKIVQTDLGHSVKQPGPSLIGPPPPIPTLFDPSKIHPIYTLTANEQKAKLVKKLAMRYNTEPALRTNPAHIITTLGGKIDKDGIHIFVDLSNICIGFYNQLKLNRGLRRDARIKQPPFSYSSLALVLERGRPVARRVLAGSHVSMLYNQMVTRPSHIVEAKKYGYELNILERVCKPQPVGAPKKKRGGTGSGYATSGSASELPSTFRTAFIEQGVDEILQMKLLESLVDTNKPSIVVLASGDAAEAEFSGGFLKNVERALEKGWKVELVAWKDGLNAEYRSEKFLKRWEGKFKIIELDEFCEEMLGLYTSPYPPDFEHFPGRT
jgi:hypothetical protein